MIRIAVPNKGRLRDPTLSLLGRVGLSLPTTPNDRGLVLDAGGGRYRVLAVNARDVPEYVAKGAADCAITGTDLLAEAGGGLTVALTLNFGKARLELAVPEGSGARDAGDLPSGTRVATSYPNLTREFFRARRQEVVLVPVSGAVEAAPGMGIADAIADLVETGATMRSNALRPIATLFSSSAAVVVGGSLAPDVQGEVDELVLALQSVSRAERCRYLMANVPREALSELSALLPGVSGPTILNLLGRDDWVAVHAVVEADGVNGIVAVLKKRGATGILISPLERMVL
ncbi:MAG: ATP phosphoribosyltransferase [Euryarchaeota archaeon]|nr:ATP phosphoribosyltransferase [Euryarchaeota archaeon]MDE1836747.1 ATP phosphoribosyltransferase [Euryarchaeota archaeon]MDE1879765.1 ATP phosphoribosyltransferase [Euryarchaeota archaeon]MDE2044731.1 ATP phosphoribosyltransferase [Thermoplasmata archaeon]